MTTYFVGVSFLIRHNGFICKDPGVIACLLIGKSFRNRTVGWRSHLQNTDFC